MTRWIRRLFSVERQAAVRLVLIALVAGLAVDLLSQQKPYFGIDGALGFDAALAVLAGLACYLLARLWDSLFALAEDEHAAPGTEAMGIAEDGGGDD